MIKLQPSKLIAFEGCFLLPYHDHETKCDGFTAETGFTCTMGIENTMVKEYNIT